MVLVLNDVYVGHLAFQAMRFKFSCLEFDNLWLLILGFLNHLDFEFVFCKQRSNGTMVDPL